MNVVGKFAIFLDIGLSSDQRAFRENIGLVESQALSWGHGKTKLSGIEKLFSILLESGCESFELINKEVDILPEKKTLQDFFFEFVKTALNSDNFSFDSSLVLPSIIGFNLMPFHLSTTLIDKIMQGFIDALSTMPGYKAIKYFFMVRNLDWFSKSFILRGLIDSAELAKPLSVIDFRGYHISFTPGNEVINPDIPRSVFQEILGFEGDEFYHSLIYQTNSYIGHFKLANSHIRTHYDFYEFVTRDAVAEYLNLLFSELTDKDERVILIGVGLEQGMINHISYYFLYMNSSKVLGYVPYFERKFRGQKETELIYKADSIVIVTDIVNSGKTVLEVLEVLEKMGIKGQRVKIFSIVNMKNSPKYKIKDSEYKAAETIRRDYYPPDEKECPLCKLGQPIHEVNESKDFAWVADTQLTAFDFWELVFTSKALIKWPDDERADRFLYRVDTVAILKRYANWLRNVVKAKIDQYFPNCSPDALCTVYEKSGIEFAELVLQALNLDRKILVPVSKGDLERTTPRSLPLDVNPFSELGPDVLIVDDGINKGATMTSLIEFCRAAERRILGAIVFDSRLDADEIRVLEHEMKSAKILCLYTWPSKPIEIF